MSLRKSQQGMSVLGVLILLALIAFLASAVFKMAPHYMDNMALEDMITSIETEKAADVHSVGDFYAHINKRLMVNNIRDFDLEKALKVRIENGEFLAHLKYEKREPLIENLDLVARFDKEFRVRMP